MSKGNAQISEEALLQDFCERIGHLVQPIFVALGAHDIVHGRVFMDEWRPDNMSVVLNDPHRLNKKYINRIRLNGLYYDPKSDRVDSSPRSSTGKPKPVPNGTKTIINPYDDQEFPVDLSHTDKLSNRHRTSLNLSSTFTSTTEAEGSYGGVSLKQTIELSLGISMDKEKEESHEQEDTATLPGVSIPAGKKLIQTVTKQSVMVETDFKMVAYPDFKEIKLDFGDNAGDDPKTESNKLMYNSGWGRNREFSVEGFLGLLQLLNGGDWRVREMRRFKHVASDAAKKSLKWLSNRSNRAVHLEGTDRDIFDDNLTIHPRFVDK